MTLLAWLIAALMAGLLLWLLAKSLGGGGSNPPVVQYHDEGLKTYVTVTRSTSSGLTLEVKDGGTYSFRFRSTPMRDLIRRGVARSTRYGYSMNVERVDVVRGATTDLGFADKATRLRAVIESPYWIRFLASWNESVQGELSHDIVAVLVDEEARHALPELVENEVEGGLEYTTIIRKILFRPGEASGEVSIPPFVVVQSKYPYRTEARPAPDRYSVQEPRPGDLLLALAWREDEDSVQWWLDEFDGQLEQRSFEHPRLDEIMTKLRDTLARENPAAHDFLMKRKVYPGQDLAKGDRLLGGA